MDSHVSRKITPNVGCQDLWKWWRWCKIPISSENASGGLIICLVFVIFYGFYQWGCSPSVLWYGKKITPAVFWGESFGLAGTTQNRPFHVRQFCWVPGATVATKRRGSQETLFPDVASAKEIISVGAIWKGNVALLTWMSQEVSKWLANGFITPIYPIYR